MTTNWMAETRRDVLPHSSGPKKSGTKVAGGLVPSGGPEGICARLSPGLWMPPEILGVAWTEASLDASL